jgi:hypothetical protein
MDTLGMRLAGNCVEVEDVEFDPRGQFVVEVEDERKLEGEIEAGTGLKGER